MKLLIIGQGGREHAIAYACQRSDLVSDIFIAPGNAGTATENKCQNVELSATNIEGLVKFALDNAIDLTIVGPEQPLSLGIVDTFVRHNLKCFGPSQKASQLESSKHFCKQFLKDHDIPTATFQSFTDAALAIEYVETQPMPIVIKANGLAAGKGVVICHDKVEAKTTINDMLLNQAFGQAGNKIIIERFLRGEELSFIALVDGKTVLPLASSQDHKARYANDQGPNTGGMGAYSPAPLLSHALNERIMQSIIYPTVEGLVKEGIHYQGFLYAGLMITDDQTPYVLEYNCRLGDPEAQPLLMRLQTDFVTLALACVDNQLQDMSIDFDPRPALGVVMVQDTYPGPVENGMTIEGLNTQTHPDIKVFHAGTTTQGAEVVTNGGRVLTVSAIGQTLSQAKDLAYQGINQIHWRGADYRKDIGARALPTKLNTQEPTT